MAGHVLSSFTPHKLKASISSSNFFSVVTSIPFQQHLNLHFPFSTRRNLKCSSSTSVSSSAASTSFTWDDVFRIVQTGSHSSDLQGFIDKVKTCNRGYEEERHHFLPFLMEDQIVGYVHTGFADHLRRFQDVFTFFKEKYSGGPLDVGITLNEKLKSPEERTKAVGDVVKILGEKIIPGIRNELYPVSSSFGTPVFFSLERAAAPYFGIKAYGVHMNGYVEKDGEKYLWIGKRSETKPTFPGMLDHLVAGGLPHGIPCGENVIKECEEEAGIPRSISNKAIPVGAVSYNDIDGFRYKRDVLFCYDLKLPQDFVPINQDGEVGSFKLMAVSDVGNVISRTQFFKANCNLVIIDFLFRHGYIMPEQTGYLKLLQSLRSPNCS